MLTICVDFDGTIVDHAFPEIGKPIPLAIDYLKKFIDNGAKVILFTMRSDREDVDYLTQAVNYLKDNEIELYGINENPSQKTWTTSPKAYGHVYIDDAAIGCPLQKINGFYRLCVDWEIVGPEVLGMLK